VLEGLDVEIQGIGAAIKTMVYNLAGEEPLVVQRNTIRGGFVGIHVLGGSGVCLRNNSITDSFQGVRIEELVTQVQVATNLIGKCGGVAGHFNNLQPQSREILLENNTLFHRDFLIKIWDDDPPEDYGSGHRVVLQNNLLIGAESADTPLVRNGDTPPAIPSD